MTLSLMKESQARKINNTNHSEFYYEISLGNGNHLATINMIMPVLISPLI